jgi:hypothetical protein
MWKFPTATSENRRRSSVHWLLEIVDLQPQIQLGLVESAARTTVTLEETKYVRQHVSISNTRARSGPR